MEGHIRQDDGQGRHEGVADRRPGNNDGGSLVGLGQRSRMGVSGQGKVWRGDGWQRVTGRVQRGAGRKCAELNSLGWGHTQAD